MLWHMFIYIYVCVCCSGVCKLCALASDGVCKLCTLASDETIYKHQNNTYKYIYMVFVNCGQRKRESECWHIGK